MEFYLKYQGPLISTASSVIKHQLRCHFHKQLKNLFSIDPNLKDREEWKLQEKEKTNKQKICCIVKKRDFYFAPIISSKLKMLAEIDITLLWPDLPGQIIGSGDIDNKLKTLLDALSCPAQDNQLNNIVLNPDEVPLYCLLEDDKLIQTLNVRTHTLYENYDKTEIFVLIHVKSKVTSTIWSNIGL